MQSIRRISRPSLVVSCAVTALCSALLSLAGDLAEFAPLADLFRGHQIVVLNALVCVAALAGAVLLRHQNGDRRIIMLFLTTAGTIALISLAEHLFRLGPLIDRPELQLWAQANSDFPGRMSSNTSVAVLALTLVGFVDLGMPSRRGMIVSMVLCIGAALIGLLGVFGRLFALDFLYRPLGLVQIVPLMGGLLLLLAIAFFAQSRRTAEHLPVADFHLNGVIRIVVVLLVAITGLASFAVMQQRLEAALSDSLTQRLRERADFIAATLDQFDQRVAFSESVPGLADMLLNAEAGGALPDPSLLAQAQTFLSHGYSALAYFDLHGQALASVGEFRVDKAARPIGAIDLSNRPRAERLGYAGGYYLFAHEAIWKDHRVVGYIESEQPVRMLSRLTLLPGSAGKSAEIALCGRDRDGVMCFPDEVTSAIYRPQASGWRQRLIQTALNDKPGSERASGARREPLLAAYRPVGDTGLVLLITSDLSDVYAPILSAFQRILPLLALLALVAILVVQWFVRPLVRQLLSARRAAERSEERFRAASEGGLDALFLLEAVRGPDGEINDFRFAYANTQGARMLGASPQDVVGTLLGQRVPAMRKSGWMGRYIRVLEYGEPLHGELQAWLPGASPGFWIHQRIAPLGDGLAVTVRDITAQKVAEQQLRIAARTDSLTGLPNRALLMDRVERAIVRVARQPAVLALLYIDVDHFKSINDRFGHATGDALLVEFATRLSRCVRVEDTVARLGGDEFVVLVEGLNGRGEAFRIADAILQAVRVPMYLNGHTVSATASIGIAFHMAADKSPSTFLARADQALYGVKRRGRDGYFAVEASDGTGEPMAA